MEEAERWEGVNTSDSIVQELMTRGVVEVIVREDFEKALRSGRKLRVKLGIDPTGPLLHIGRSVPLFKLRQYQQAGHQVVLIIGDGTALVGDASDKDSERPLLTSEQIEKNMATYKEQVGRVLDLDKVEFRYNGDWLLKLGLKDIIRTRNERRRALRQGLATRNAAVEAQILLWVKKMTRRRGAMFSNLPRTNLLGDLMVPGSNGALLNQHEVIRAIRDTAREVRGWAPPPRALTEPAGAMGLRDAFSVTELLERVLA